MKHLKKNILMMLAIMIVAVMCGLVSVVNGMEAAPAKKTLKYGPWIITKGYTAGDMVSYAGKDWMALHAIAPMTDKAPTASDAWAEVQE